ncbi:MAG: SLC13 family permease [Pyramidobacter sp.]|nr:SLC13 family permease [Pyramidobacter sp.]
MISLPVLSLVVLVGVIALSVVTKKNCGIIALVAAYLLGTFAVGMKASAIYAAGWPMGVFFIALSTTFLFSVATVNGTVEVMAKNIAFFAGGSARLLPVIFFIGGAVISGIGAGGLVVAIIMPIALFVAVENKIPVIMMSLVTMGGIMVGGLSPLAINGIVANRLAIEQGITNYSALWIPYGVSMTLFSVAAYIVFGGITLPRAENCSGNRFTPFDRNQTLTLTAIAVLLVGVIAFKQDLGLLAFACGGVLLLLNAADQKKVIASMPWGTILLICGMAVLLKVVVTAGGITLLSEKLKTVLSPRSAQPIFVALGGLMGAVSSGTGVVMPTLIPLAADIAKQMPEVGSPLALIIAVIVGTNGVVISPLSTVGGLCVASAPEGVDRDKLYNQLLLSAVIFCAGSAVAAFMGLY